MDPLTQGDKCIGVCVWGGGGVSYNISGWNWGAGFM